jgi:flagellar hook assembly protein FlgD
VTAFALAQNYPNPFNPSTTIEFSMPEAGTVKLAIYSLTGRLVRTLVDGDMPSGRHRVAWSGRNDDEIPVASGIYFCRIIIQKLKGEVVFTETRRLSLLK